MAEAREETPWHATFPAPKCAHPTAIAPQVLLEMLKAGRKAGVDFLLVDVRRMDHEVHALPTPSRTKSLASEANLVDVSKGGTIGGSLNLPAQSLFYSIPTLYNLCRRSNIGTVIWYCGSSRGRGPRCAGWFDDYIKEQGDGNIYSHVLEGGIKGWVSLGSDFIARMDGYAHDAWGKE